MATTLTWLGHAALRLVTAAGTHVYVDPFLTGNPSCPGEEREPERCDLVVVTHGHGDHVGDTVPLGNRFSCPIVAQVELRRWLVAQGASDDGMAHSINKGGSVRLGDVVVTLTHAQHSSLIGTTAICRASQETLSLLRRRRVKRWRLGSPSRARASRCRPPG